MGAGPPLPRRSAQIGETASPLQALVNVRELFALRDEPKCGDLEGVVFEVSAHLRVRGLRAVVEGGAPRTNGPYRAVFAPGEHVGARVAVEGDWQSTNDTALDNLSLTHVTGGECPRALVTRRRYEDLGTLN
jgi:hypothetical protein